MNLIVYKGKKWLIFRLPDVINRASDILIKILQENGKHARSALGTYSLPNDITVEIELIDSFRR